MLLLLLIGTCFILHMFKSSTIVWAKTITIPYLLFSAYLVLHFILLREEYPADYLLQSYNSYYFFLLLFPFAAFLSVESNFFGKLLVYISAPLLLLGFAQYLSNSTILPVSSADQYFSVFSHEYYGKIRAFSLFNSGLNYGHFLSLLGAFVLCYAMKRRRIARLALIMILIIVLLACYTTLTRNLYIEFIFTLFTAVLLSVKQKKNRNPFFDKIINSIPFIYGFTAALLVFPAQLFELISSSGSVLLKQESLIIRLQTWQYYLPLWTEHGLYTLLFGVGLIQHERFPITENVVIDNSFLAIGLHTGIIGLVLWFVLMRKMWLYLLTIQRTMPDNVPISAMTALCSTWVSSGLFNNNFTLYAILFMMIFPLYLSEKSRLQSLRQPKDFCLTADAKH